MDNDKKSQKLTRRKALLGLVGAILTVCGTLTGALIGGLATIYQVERQAQQFAIAAPQSDLPLSVDTYQINISSSDAAKLDPSEYLVLDDLGFITAQPRTGWIDNGQMHYPDLFQEEAANLSPMIFFYKWVKFSWDEQPVRQIRYSQPVMVQFLEGSQENGYQVDLSMLDTDTYAFYNQITTLALSKEVVEPDFNLYGLALTWGGLHQGGVNELVSNPESQYIFEQVSWELKGVSVDGKKTDLTLQRWALFTESSDHYYIVEVQFVPAKSQPEQVWDDLQTYINSFRVIE